MHRLFVLSFVLVLCIGCTAPDETQTPSGDNPSGDSQSDASAAANARLDRDLPIADEPLVELNNLADRYGGKVRRYSAPVEPSIFQDGAQATSAGDTTNGEQQVYVELNLVGAEITDAEIAELAEQPAFQEVTSLLLSNSQITDDALVNIAKAKKLQMVDLMNTQVTDAGLEHLMGHPQLRYLMTDGSSISFPAADRLLRSLPALEGKW